MAAVVFLQHTSELGAGRQARPFLAPACAKWPFGDSRTWITTAGQATVMVFSARTFCQEMFSSPIAMARICRSSPRCSPYCP